MSDATLRSDSAAREPTVMSKRIGQAIRRLRLSLGISPKEFAADAGLPASFVVKLENGQVDCDIRTLEKFASALNLELSEILLYAYNEVDPTHALSR